VVCGTDVASWWNAEGLVWPGVGGNCHPATIAEAAGVPKPKPKPNGEDAWEAGRGPKSM
jgi:hypothetical protein